MTLSFTLETSAAELSTGKGFHMPAPGDTGRRARRRAIQPPDMWGGEGTFLARAPRTFQLCFETETDTIWARAEPRARLSPP